MNSRKILFTVFILVVLVQLFVPAKMIFDKEKVLKEGTEYKFRTAPIDPTDPFRGKYITLNYKDNTVQVQNEKEWTQGEVIYVSLSSDNEGFAIIESVSKEKPVDNKDFVKAKVSFVSVYGDKKLTIAYPFDRYYMEESKASGAEQTYRESNTGSMQKTYALVSVKEGDAVLKDVIIDGISIREIVRNNQEGKR